MYFLLSSSRLQQVQIQIKSRRNLNANMLQNYWLTALGLRMTLFLYLATFLPYFHSALVLIATSLLYFLTLPFLLMLSLLQILLTYLATFLPYLPTTLNLIVTVLVYIETILPYLLTSFALNATYCHILQSYCHMC